MENSTSYFVELDENNFVIRVLCLSTESLLNSDGEEDEQIGVDILKGLTSSTLKWKRCWQNANKDLSKRFAYPGPFSFYDENLDIFYGDKPYEGWFFDTSSLEWKPPVGSPPKPELTQEQIDKYYTYNWDSELYSKGENPWHLRSTPPPSPLLTDEQRDSKGFYFWDEEEVEWQFVIPGEPPELTEQQISDGYIYQWDEPAHRNGQNGWYLVKTI